VDRLPFARRIAIDFEYRPPTRERDLQIVSMYAEDMDTGENWYLVEGEFGVAPPFPLDGAVIVAYVAEAELRCFRKLGWGLPSVVCFHGEYRRLTNHIEMPDDPARGRQGNQEADHAQHCQ
jgi:hypothetical protein